MTKWKSSDVPLSLTPLFFRLRLLHKGQHLRTVSSGTANRVVYGSQQTDLCNHCGTILIINCLETSLVMMVKIQRQHAQHGASPGDASGKEPAC